MSLELSSEEYIRIVTILNSYLNPELLSLPIPTENEYCKFYLEKQRYRVNDSGMGTSWYKKAEKREDVIAEYQRKYRILKDNISERYYFFIDLIEEQSKKNNEEKRRQLIYKTHTNGKLINVLLILNRTIYECDREFQYQFMFFQN